MPKILCFGDSITYGAWDREGGWVVRVRKRIDKVCIDSDLQSFLLTYNLGISSDTSERLLERFPAEIEAHSKEPGDNLVIISIGTNDSIKRTDGSHWIELPKFEENIRKLIEQAKQSALGVICLGNLPVDESKCQPYRNQPELSSANADIQQYEQTTAKVCKELGANFIPVFEEAQAANYTDWLLNDGIHPNDQGHAFLADKVWQFLVANNWVVY